MARVLLDHVVRADEDGLGDREPQGLGGLEVHDQLEAGGLLHRRDRREPSRAARPSLSRPEGKANIRPLRLIWPPREGEGERRG